MRVYEKYKGCKKCYGKGWYAEMVPDQPEDEPYPDWREKYCDCPAGDLRRDDD